MSTIRPHKPVLTEKNLSSQAGKVCSLYCMVSGRNTDATREVFIVTGASGGIGLELTKILYQHDARVYLAARSESKTTEAIKRIEQAHPSSRGKLVFLRLELDDLSTIKRSAEEFLTKESRLDVLWLNAGVMIPPQGSKTKQGHELQLGVNNLGHFLFVTVLQNVLESTARIAPKASVRVIWVSSSTADSAPKPALDFENMDYHRDEGPWTKYGRSKAGNVIHCAEFVRRTQGTGIISLVSGPALGADVV
jgi:NAD(P)-dependent dehydrogenase (short-subunit alcohol dehydrogenase family)